MPLITKTRYLEGSWCPTLLWYQWHARSELPAPDPKQEADLEEGRQVGILAQSRYPGGVTVAHADYGETLLRTQEALLQRVPIYEASFQHGDAYCRADILVPVQEGWDIIEVKKSTKVKDEHLMDIGFQLHVLRACGIPVHRAYVMHIDTSYERNGAIDPHALFAVQDCTQDAQRFAAEVPRALDRLHTIIAGTRPPIEPVHMCDHPYACPITALAPPGPVHPVGELYYGRKLAREQREGGILALTDVPDNHLSPKQLIQKHAILSGKTHIDAPAVQQWLAKLQYPLAYFDFETIGGAIPPLDGTHPYEQVPFQFSLHVQEEPDGPLTHHEFLAPPGDPRPAIIDAMRVIPAHGSIIAYNAEFEQKCIRGLLRTQPDAMWLAELLPRFADLLVPFKEFWLHHPAQHGSNSIKKVLPAFTGTTYDDLEIHEGGTASKEYQRTHAPDADPQEREKVRAALLAYCKRDTEAMVAVLDAVRHAAGS